MRERAERVIAAGSDLALHCNGDLDEMQQAAAGVPFLAGRARQRFEAALAVLNQRKPYDMRAAEAHLAGLVGRAADRAESV
jgi:beta-N-acetylhexosaminidase